MTVRRIITVPDPILRKKSESVNDIDKDIKKLMNDMLETMYDAPGIGLAAIQIGIPKRIVVMDVSKEPNKKEPLLRKINNNSKEWLAAGDIEIIYTGLRPGEKLYEELLIDGKSEPTQHPLIFKAKETLSMTFK